MLSPYGNKVGVFTESKEKKEKLLEQCKLRDEESILSGKKIWVTDTRYDIPTLTLMDKQKAEKLKLKPTNEVR